MEVFENVVEPLLCFRVRRLTRAYHIHDRCSSANFADLRMDVLENVVEPRFLAPFSLHSVGYEGFVGSKR